MDSLGHIIALIAAIALVVLIAGIALDTSTQIEPVGKIDSVHPIQDLNHGWWLVEVRQETGVENPFPIGPAKFKVKVPHLLRLPTREIQILRNATHDS